MEKDYLYLAKELIQRLSSIIDWINDNPDVTGVNIYEVVDCLMEFGYTQKIYRSIDVFNEKVVCDDINDKLTSLMNSMLEKRKDSIEYYISRCGISYTFRDFVKKMFIGQCEHNNKYKELLAKEFSILFYICKQKDKKIDFQYDNVEEFERIQTISKLYGDDLSELLLEKIGRDYKFNPSRKGEGKYYTKKDCYDLTFFSSMDEEKKYIDEKTSQFKLDKSLLENSRNNGIIVITRDKFYAVEPVNIHQMAFQKLFRCIDDSDVFLDISEVEDYYVFLGNILIRVINRDGVKGFDPYIPQDINEFQRLQLESFISKLDDVYSVLRKNDSKNAENISHGIDVIKHM